MNQPKWTHRIPSPDPRKGVDPSWRHGMDQGAVMFDIRIDEQMENLYLQATHSSSVTLIYHNHIMEEVFHETNAVLETPP